MTCRNYENSVKGKFTDSEIEEEFQDIARRIEMERQHGSYIDISRKANLRRTIIVGANSFLQATGQNFTSNYGALFAKSLGIINPFVVTVMLGAVNAATAFLAMVLTDKLGRRQVFLLLR